MSAAGEKPVPSRPVQAALGAVGQPNRRRTTSHAHLDLIAHVALVATQGDMAAALLVSKRAWTDAREEAGHPELLSAENTRQRLAIPWPILLALAFTEPGRRMHFLGRQTRRDDIPYFAPLRVRGTTEDALVVDTSGMDFDDEGYVLGKTGQLVELAIEEERAPQERPPSRPVGEEQDARRAFAIRSLRAVALATGETPAQSTYERSLEQLEYQRARRGIYPPLGAPKSPMILDLFGTWNRAIEEAGLPPRPNPRAASAMAQADAIEMCLEETGELPNGTSLARWGSQRDISIDRTTAWSADRALVKERRAARGLTTPARSSHLKAWFEANAQPVPYDRSRKRRSRTIPHEAVLESLRIFMQEHVPAGTPQTLRGLQEACARDPRLVRQAQLYAHFPGKKLHELFALGATL
jgi:hypothetical protein